MGKIRELKVRTVRKILNKYGFKLVGQGRHAKYRNEDERITVPVPESHGIITRGVIQSLIRQTGIPREEFFG